MFILASVSSWATLSDFLSSQNRHERCNAEADHGNDDPNHDGRDRRSRPSQVFKNYSRRNHVRVCRVEHLCGFLILDADSVLLRCRRACVVFSSYHMYRWAQVDIRNQDVLWRHTQEITSGLGHLSQMGVNTHTSSKRSQAQHPYHEIQDSAEEI